MPQADLVRIIASMMATGESEADMNNVIDVMQAQERAASKDLSTDIGSATFDPANQMAGLPLPPQQDDRPWRRDLLRVPEGPSQEREKPSLFPGGVTPQGIGTGMKSAVKEPFQAIAEAYKDPWQAAKGLGETAKSLGSIAQALAEPQRLTKPSVREELFQTAQAFSGDVPDEPLDQRIGRALVNIPALLFGPKLTKGAFRAVRRGARPTPPPRPSSLTPPAVATGGFPPGGAIHTPTGDVLRKRVLQQQAAAATARRKARTAQVLDPDRDVRVVGVEKTRTAQAAPGPVPFGPAPRPDPLRRTTSRNPRSTAPGAEGRELTEYDVAHAERVFGRPIAKIDTWSDEFAARIHEGRKERWAVYKRDWEELEERKARQAQYVGNRVPPADPRLLTFTPAKGAIVGGVAGGAAGAAFPFTKEGDRFGSMLAGGIYGGMLGAGVAQFRKSIKNLPSRGTHEYVNKVASAAQQLRGQAALSGMSIPINIAAAAGTSITTAWDKWSLAPLKEALRLPTNLKVFARTLANPTTFGAGLAGEATQSAFWKTPFSRVIGAIDEQAYQFLRRAGLSEVEANRRLLRTRLKYGGKGPGGEFAFSVPEELASTTGRLLVLFQRTPINQFFEGFREFNRFFNRDILPGARRKGKTPARSRLLTAAMTGLGYAAGEALDTSDYRHILLLRLFIAAAGTRGLPMTMGIVGSTAAWSNLVSMSPFPEFGLKPQMILGPFRKPSGVRLWEGLRENQ